MSERTPRDTIEPIAVGDRKIGPGEPLFFIAEIGINHNQDLDLALAHIDAAADAGCSAAKFQTFRAQDLYIESKKAGSYRLMGKNIPIYDLHTGLEMPEEWIPKLQEHCAKRGIIFFSTVVAPHGIDMLDGYGVPVFKISSYDFTNIPLIRYLVTKKKPVIISNGGATLAETEETLDIFKEIGTPVALMHCVVKYPAPFGTANLAVMEALRDTFRIPVGFSDNGFADDEGVIDAKRVPVAAAEAGADLFEIHVTLDRSLPGPDHGFATEPHELKSMVKRMNEARAAYNAGKRTSIDPLLWGSPVKRTTPEEEYVRNFAYKCLFTSKPVRKGERFTGENVAVLRPGAYKRGLEPRYYDRVVGQTARVGLSAFEPITWDTIQ
jgi:sialic acid synthase SpsE